jgi:hypothetical protein
MARADGGKGVQVRACMHLNASIGFCADQRAPCGHNPTLITSHPIQRPPQGLHRPLRGPPHERVPARQVQAARVHQQVRGGGRPRRRPWSGLLRVSAVRRPVICHPETSPHCTYATRRPLTSPDPLPPTKRFTGSAGSVVVTPDQALLWTDGRYFLQAEQELGPGWTLMRAGTGHCPEIPDWLAEVLPAGARVGIDPFCHTVEAVRSLSSKLQVRPFARGTASCPCQPVVLEPNQCEPILTLQ